MKLRPETMIALTARKARQFIAAPALALTLAVGSLGGAAVTLAPTPAAAVPVYDVANHTQNILVAVRALEQINNQIEQITNQIEQIQNQAKMLENFGGNYLSAITDLTSDTEALLNASDAIANNINNISASYKSLYPEDYASASFEDMMDQLRRQRAANREAAEQAMTVGAQVRNNNAKREARVDSVVNASLSAPGQTAVAQSQAQLLGILSDQIADLTMLIDQIGRVDQQRLAEDANHEAMQEEMNARLNQRRSQSPQTVGDLTYNN